MSWHGSIPNIKSVKKVMSGFDSSVVANLKVTYNDDSVWIIPLNEENSHYQQVLEWVDAGNTIEDAD
jgi:hypothetical protein